MPFFIYILLGILEKGAGSLPEITPTMYFPHILNIWAHGPIPDKSVKQAEKHKQ